MKMIANSSLDVPIEKSASRIMILRKKFLFSILFILKLYIDIFIMSGIYISIDFSRGDLRRLS